MAPDQNLFWTGLKQATVWNEDWVSASWGKGDGAANRLRMLNGAFEIYYILKNSIKMCDDSTMRELMMKELDDAGTQGFGIGVKDMDDAFQHWNQPGKWKDNNLKTYMKANGIFGAATPSIAGAQYCWGLPTNDMPGPEAATNFFNALDSKMSDLASAIRGHNAEVQKLSAAVAAKNAGTTGEALQSIAKYGNIAKKFMFLAPKASDTFL